MKTQKRTSVLVPLNPEDWPFDPPHHAGDMLARWKRKNRVKQLKRSLERYKDGTNLGFYSHELHAYMLLQKLKKPDKKASVNKWNFYTQRLLDIQSHIMQAITQASREAGACWEREEQNRRDAQKLFQEKLEEHLRTKERKEQEK